MSLNVKQALFTECFGLLLDYARETHQLVILKEAHRTREQARIYHEQGKGILNSVHCLSLACDILVYKDGTISWDIEDYRDLGAHWLTIEPTYARWGGNFKKRSGQVGRDPYHFSFEHNGVQ